MGTISGMLCITRRILLGNTPIGLETVKNWTNSWAERLTVAPLTGRLCSLYMFVNFNNKIPSQESPGKHVALLAISTLCKRCLFEKPRLSAASSESWAGYYKGCAFLISVYYQFSVNYGEKVHCSKNSLIWYFRPCPLSARSGGRWFHMSHFPTVLPSLAG